ncbi:Quinone oxidoreductase [Mycobacterium sp. 012931]|nr:Quinone oxidoreductase [Mycobacterium sp. 012931]MBC9865715.1 Quinone oxidoreductase [Mycobacterium pseudoshottsii]
MPDRNRRFLLRERPTGRIGPNTFELSEAPIPEIGDGEALVRVTWISLDPTNRGWINDMPSYLPRLALARSCARPGSARLSSRGIRIIRWV